VVPTLLRIAGDGFQMVFVDHLGVVQQAPDQGALAVVDVAAGQEAQHFFAFVLAQVGEDVLADQIRLMRHDSPLEITLTFFIFHRACTIVVDDTALALGSSRQEHFLDDVRQRLGFGLHRAGQRVAAQGTETDFLFDDAGFVLRTGCSRMRSSSIMISVPFFSITSDAAAKYSGTMGMPSR
jgi:hypothetical protein